VKNYDFVWTFSLVFMVGFSILQVIVVITGGWYFHETAFGAHERDHH